MEFYEKNIMSFKMQKNEYIIFAIFMTFLATFRSFLMLYKVMLS